MNAAEEETNSSYIFQMNIERQMNLLGVQDFAKLATTSVLRSQKKGGTHAREGSSRQRFISSLFSNGITFSPAFIFSYFIL